jgi:hypothetical protein
MEEKSFFDIRSQLSRSPAVMTSPAPTFASFLRDQYNKIFDRPWPLIPSALIIAALNVFLFAFDRPWTASDGMRNWGDGLLQSLGLVRYPDLLPPLLYSSSLLNIGLLIGAMATAYGNSLTEPRVCFPSRALERIDDRRPGGRAHGLRRDAFFRL